MDKQEVSENILVAVRDVFSLDKEFFVSDKFKVGDIEEWDSLGHIKLFLSIEKKLKIKFSMQDILRLNSVESIIDRAWELFQ